MPAVYDKMGIRFQYPDNWTVDEGEALTERNSVSVYSPGGAFWTVVVCPPSEDPGKLADDVLGAMRQEYDNLDAEPVTETVAGRELVGYDLNFYCLDLTNTARVRGVATAAATYIIHCQAEDREYRTAGEVFRAITASLLG